MKIYEEKKRLENVLMINNSHISTMIFEMECSKWIGRKQIGYKENNKITFKLIKQILLYLFFHSNGFTIHYRKERYFGLFSRSHSRVRRSDAVFHRFPILVLLEDHKSRSIGEYKVLIQ